MMIDLGRRTSRKVIPMPMIKKQPSFRGAPRGPKGMDRITMMKAVNTATLEQADDPALISQQRKERRIADQLKRKEMVQMEKEDYTYTPEGAIRLLQIENRMEMKEEDRKSKQFRASLLELLKIQKEAEKKEMEKIQRTKQLEKRKVELEERKKRNEMEQVQKKIERDARMKRLKEAADGRAKATHDAKMKKQFLKEQEIQMQEMENETMALEEEFEKHRLVREAEENEVRLIIELEESKWKDWEEEEEKKEEERNNARREKLAEQYGEDNTRRAQMNKMKREKETQKRKTMEKSKSNLALATAVLATPTILLGAKPLGNMNPSQLQSEKRKIMGQKRKANMKLKELKSNEESSSAELQQLLSTCLALDARIEEIDLRISGQYIEPIKETIIESDISEPIRESVNPPIRDIPYSGPSLVGMNENKLKSELRKSISLKRKFNLTIKSWIDSFKKEHQGREPNDVEKTEIQDTMNEFTALDQRIIEIKRVMDGGGRLPEETSSDVVTSETLKENISNDEIFIEDIQSMSSLQIETTLGKYTLQLQTCHYTYANLPEQVADNVQECSELEKNIHRLEETIQSLQNHLVLFDDVPFAYVSSSILENSPAAVAGLCENDYLCRFGAINATSSTRNLLDQIYENAQELQGNVVSIVIQRWDIEEYRAVTLSLVPTLAESLTDAVGCELTLCLEENDHQKAHYEQEATEAQGEQLYEEPEDVAALPLTPFCTIENIVPDSIASDAGFMEGDCIVSFGSILSSPQNNDITFLQEITSYLRQHIDENIPVQITRETDIMETLSVMITASDLGGSVETIIGFKLSLYKETATTSISETTTTSISEATPTPINETATTPGATPTPLFVVEMVLSNSPAEEAELQDGDFVMTFGNVFTSVEDDMSVVINEAEKSVGISIPITLQRWNGYEYAAITLQLQPHEWSGEGVVGCSMTTYTEYCAREQEYDDDDIPCRDCMETDELATAAHAAAYSGHYDCLEALSYDFNVFCQDEMKRTPLFYASYANQYDIVQLLLSISPELVDGADVNGDTALHAATSAGALDVIELLCDYDANINACNHEGLIPCHIAPEIDILETLYNHGGDLYAVDKIGKLPLHHAMASGERSCVEFLCQLCPDTLSVCDEEGNTPCHEAAEFNFVQGIQLLCQYGISIAAVEKVNVEKKTCLQIAQEEGHEECVQVLNAFLNSI